MTETRRKLKILLAERGLKFCGLREATGFAAQTIYNSVDERSDSPKVRQAIVNVLQASDLFPGVVPTKRPIIVFSPGDEIDFAGCDDAGGALKEWSAGLPGRVEMRGSMLVFTKHTAVYLQIAHDGDSAHDLLPKCPSSRI